MVVNGQTTQFSAEDLIGQNICKELSVLKLSTELRVAIICNWQTKCGISTYSKYLVDALSPKIKELRIFSEESAITTGIDTPNVIRCWKRGESLLPLVKEVINWNPDFIIIQHEYGIFPNAFYFMQMMMYFDTIPYVVTMHSAYEHLDKLVYTSCIKNIIVHSESGKDILLKNGTNNNITVIPHGCITYPNPQELWNICHNPYTIMQFGFGFAYKGVERALEAIHYLKNKPKFKNAFYFYLLSDNEHTSHIHNEYYKQLLEKIEQLELQPNVAIIRKFQSDNMLNLYLRLAKIAIFPYINNPNNTVYASSGAIRVAMANGIPVIASESHLFDDLDKIVPRPNSHIELAKEIDKIFSSHIYKNSLIERNKEFLEQNRWDVIADHYLDVFKQLSS